MRNAQWYQSFFLLAGMTLTGVLTGCAAESTGGSNLQLGYEALGAHQYDRAISSADTYLSMYRTGPGSAEAYYLKGRGFEQKVANSPQEARNNLQSARTAYLSALQAVPSSKLEPLVRCGLANVAFWQEDYGTAESQWLSAYDKLDTPETRGMVLYRIGVSRQRMGMFDRANETFARTMKEYAAYEVAQLSAARIGYKYFAVQVATFDSKPYADSVTVTLQKQGNKVQRALDAKGRQVVTIAPISSYSQAQALKVRLAGAYPDALIMP